MATIKREKKSFSEMFATNEAKDEIATIIEKEASLVNKKSAT